MSDPQGSQRFHDLDALRGFAMLLGVLLHGAMSFAALPVTVSPTQDIYQGSPAYRWMMDGVHGFRMPLFFLVSGMFTAMLWRRRGLTGLIRHRLTRIGLPLLLGILTIVPAVFAVNIFFSRNIWYASTRGDVPYVASFIRAGGDLNRPLSADMQPGNGGTPLHLAAASSQHRVAQHLIRAGADLRARAANLVEGTQSRATPLHWAAALSDVPMLELLIGAGAPVNATDVSGETPLDYASANTNAAVSEFLIFAGGISGGEVSLDATPQTIPATNLADHSVSDNKSASADFLGDWIRQQPLALQIFALACFFPVLAHLWFLWYLLILVAAFAVTALLIDRYQMRPISRTWFHSPALMLWLLPPTFVIQLFMVQSFGPDTASGIVPWPPTIVYYGLFFGIGALYQSAAKGQFEIGRDYATYLILGLLVLPLGIYATSARDGNFVPWHVLGSLCSATYAWLMLFGLFGLFRHAFSSPKSWVRNLSDASYWIYLVHLPIVQLLQSWVSDWALPSLLKLGFVCGLTFAISLASYQWIVRYTWIGALLHGRKKREGSSIVNTTYGIGNPSIDARDFASSSSGNG